MSEPPDNSPRDWDVPPHDWHDFTCDCEEYGFKGRGPNPDEVCMGDKCKGSRNPICFICNYLLAGTESYMWENPTNTEFNFFSSVITTTKCMFCNMTTNCITISDNSSRIGNRRNRAYPKFIIELYRKKILDDYKELFESVQYFDMTCFEKVKRPTTKYAYMCETCILINEAMNATQLENKGYRFETCDECDFCNLYKPQTQCLCLTQDEYMKYCEWLFNDPKIVSYMDPKIRQSLELYFKTYIEHIDSEFIPSINTEFISSINSVFIPSINTEFNTQPEHNLMLPE